MSFVVFFNVLKNNFFVTGAVIEIQNINKNNRNNLTMRTLSDCVQYFKFVKRSE